MRTACEREVIALHQFFEDWFLKETHPQGMTRFSEVMAPEFHIIWPNGMATDLPQLVERLQQSKGCFAGRDFQITITLRDYKALGKDFCLLMYEEWHHLDGESTGRLSSAVFGRDLSCPESVRWFHVHETDLPSK